MRRRAFIAALGGAATWTLAVIGLLLLVGLGIGSNASMPGYAPVYLDEESKAYLALPCLAEWQSRSNAPAGQGR
jgi:hypothetical protein